MLRTILIGLGAVTTAIAGYYAQRRLFGKRIDPLHDNRATYRPRARKPRYSQVHPGSDNGEYDACE